MPRLPWVELTTTVVFTHLSIFISFWDTNPQVSRAAVVIYCSLCYVPVAAYLLLELWIVLDTVNTLLFIIDIALLDAYILPHPGAHIAIKLAYLFTEDCLITILVLLAVEASRWPRILIQYKAFGYLLAFYLVVCSIVGFRKGFRVLLAARVSILYKFVYLSVLIAAILLLAELCALFGIPDLLSDILFL